MGYNWCVGVTTDLTECSVVDWISVGLHVSVSRRLSIEPLTQGEMVENI